MDRLAVRSSRCTLDRLSSPRRVFLARTSASMICSIDRRGLSRFIFSTSSASSGPIARLAPASRRTRGSSAFTPPRR
jgi:hypothetical protein